MEAKAMSLKQKNKTLFILGCFFFMNSIFLAPAFAKNHTTTLESLMSPHGYQNQTFTKKPIIMLFQQAIRESLMATPLTLDTVLNLVELNHPKLKAAAYMQKIATAKRIEKQGAFDPAVRSNNYYQEYNSPTKVGTAKDTFQNDVSLDFLTRSGIKVSAGGIYNQGAIKSPASATGDTGEYYVGFKIPILRDFLINEKSAAEKQAFIGEDIAFVNYQQTRLFTLLNAATSYWDWVANARKLDVAKTLLNVANSRSELTQARVQLGDIPAIDSVEAQQEVQRRQGLLAKAERDFQKATLKLALYLWSDPHTPAEKPSIANTPKIWLDPTGIDSNSLNEIYNTAWMNRPELKNIALEKRITQIDKKLAANQKLPALNLSIAPSYDTGNLGVGPTGKVAIETIIPLRTRTASGQLEAARFKLEKLTVDEKLTVQQIRLEVDDALSAIQTSYDRYQAALDELNSAQKMETGERQKYTLGDSTLFLLNQRERATAEAEIKLIEAKMDYEISQAALKASTGQL